MASSIMLPLEFDVEVLVEMKKLSLISSQSSWVGDVFNRETELALFTHAQVDIDFKFHRVGKWKKATKYVIGLRIGFMSLLLPNWHIYRN